MNSGMDLRRAVMLFACVGVVAALAAPATALPTPPTCAPGQSAVTGNVNVTSDDVKTYQVRPFQVAAGTTTVKVEYDWGNAGPGGGTPLTATTIDLGVWDEDGYRSADGFRG